VDASGAITIDTRWPISYPNERTIIETIKVRSNMQHTLMLLSESRACWWMRIDSDKVSSPQGATAGHCVVTRPIELQQLTATQLNLCLCRSSMTTQRGLVGFTV
jgi:hypothetical protein